MYQLEISQLKADKRRLYFWLLGSVATLVLVTGLCLGMLAVGAKSALLSQILDWARSIFINLGAGVVVVLLTLLAMRSFHIPEMDETETVAALKVSGIDSLYRNWVRDKPATDFFYNLFKDAREVEVIGVTLNNTLIGTEWFVPLFAARISDPQKTTRFIVLNPNGQEVERREREGVDHGVSKRAAISALHIEEGFRLAQCVDKEKDRFLHFFDYAPPFNYMRFDNIAIVILSMHRKGGQFPGLKLSATGWLFDLYRNHFDSVWNERSSQLNHGGGDG